MGKTNTAKTPLSDHFNHQLEKVIGWKVLQLIQTMKIKKILCNNPRKSANHICAIPQKD